MSSAPIARAGLYVQYGCGNCAPEGWLNFDASPRLRLERLPAVRGMLRATVGLHFPSNIRTGNIVRGLSVPDNSASGVYCSHVLEHLPREDLPAALRNTLNILMPGGVFRLVLPDLHWRAAKYLASVQKEDPDAADALMKTCRLGRRTKANSLVAVIRESYSQNAHFWMYDFVALKALLKETGFTGIRRCELGDASDPMFSLVEDEVRFFDGGEHELAIEAVKPSVTINGATCEPR